MCTTPSFSVTWYLLRLTCAVHIYFDCLLSVTTHRHDSYVHFDLLVCPRDKIAAEASLVDIQTHLYLPTSMYCYSTDTLYIGKLMNTYH